jgi:hypothetical protein
MLGAMRDKRGGVQTTHTHRLEERLLLCQNRTNQSSAADMVVTIILVSRGIVDLDRVVAKALDFLSEVSSTP